jgi:hypothetical protein
MFHASNFSVIILLLMGATMFIFAVRQAQPLENNWPLAYWIAFFLFASSQPTAYQPESAFIGLGCGLMLRFEFMNRVFARLIRYVEVTVFCYILVRGVNLVVY